VKLGIEDPRAERVDIAVHLSQRQALLPRPSFQKVDDSIARQNRDQHDE
jgi:hypothetical protein